MNSIVILLLLAFGSACFSYCVMRGRPETFTTVDIIAMIGALLCPLTWSILLLVAPAAALVDHFNRKEERARKP